jgi:TrmH family RNA methyltransferase
MYEIAKFDCVYVTEKVFSSITQVTTPQGIFAIIERNACTEEIDYSEDIILALDDVQDPGNLGTILRTVDSVGLKQILISKGTVDVYNPKVVRSTMGAIFRVKVIECENLKNAIKEAKKHHFKLVVTSLQTDNSMYDIDYKKKIIVIGNEANGVSKDIQDLADEKIKIPMLGKTESLNASVATGIVLYEYVRQKLLPGE